MICEPVRSPRDATVPPERPSSDDGGFARPDFETEVPELPEDDEEPG
ncbi:MAG: hypothetical protein JWO66_973 [Candidatus Eremiobacteraeota bacterium]|jgi:hypothetical protein|nr:hypothetical protein [Candidatus Eremiobacteraeota bacterium]